MRLKAPASGELLEVNEDEFDLLQKVRSSYVTFGIVYEAALRVRAIVPLPVHHQTFILSYEPPDEPIRRLLAAAGDQADRIVIREVGETFVLPRS